MFAFQFDGVCVCMCVGGCCCFTQFSQVQHDQYTFTVLVVVRTQISLGQNISVAVYVKLCVRHDVVQSQSLSQSHTPTCSNQQE